MPVDHAVYVGGMALLCFPLSVIAALANLGLV